MKVVVKCGTVWDCVRQCGTVWDCVRQYVTVVYEERKHGAG